MTGVVVERSRLEPEVRRAQLVELGAEMLSTRPMDQLVVDEIAAAAGISRGLLFHYFKSKRDFCAAVAEAVAEQFFAAIAPDESVPRDRWLHQSLDRYVRYIEEHHTAYLSLIRGTHGGDDHFASVVEHTRRRIVDRILTGSGLGDAPAPKVRLAVRGWVAFCEEVSLDWLARRTVRRDEIVALLEESLVRIVDAAR